MLNELAKQCYENAKAKGFYTNEPNFGERMALIHSEVSESLEDHRKGYPTDFTYYDGNKPCGIPFEFADIIIRVLDACGYYGIDIDKAVADKMKYNATRERMHGKLY